MNERNQSGGTRKRVVVVGAGFAGLYAARKLDNESIDLTVIDRRNFHLFQPLLYQVATGGLSPGDISAPIRGILKGQRNTRVFQADVTGIDANRRVVAHADGEIPYDILIVAAGTRHFYFGNDDWERNAPGLKTVEDALEIRRRVFEAFETAEREDDPDERRRLMTFVAIGGGPTGVEMAGAVGELAHTTLREEFRAIDPTTARIYLIEADDRILPGFPEKLSKRARRSLERLGVTVRTGEKVSDVRRDGVTVNDGESEERIDAATVLWTAGVQASPLGRIVADATGAELDRIGRVKVSPTLTVPSHPEIYVIGDLAHALGEDGDPLPGVAPTAMQQGSYVAGRILGGTPDHQPFRYRDKGSLAVIGRNSAVAAMGGLELGGYPAWLAWVLVHIWYLIDFDNKILVMIQWAFNYFTRKRGARLITHQPDVEKEAS